MFKACRNADWRRKTGNLVISASHFKLLIDIYFAFQEWQVCSSCLQLASNSSYKPASHLCLVPGDTLWLQEPQKELLGGKNLRRGHQESSENAPLLSLTCQDPRVQAQQSTYPYQTQKFTFFKQICLIQNNIISLYSYLIQWIITKLIITSTSHGI